MNKLCPYFQKPGHGEDVLSEWPTPAALFMDVNGDFVNRLRRGNPYLKIVVRLYEEESHGWRKITPKDWAARFTAIRPDYAISWTMPVGQDNADLFAEFDDWSIRFAAETLKYGIEPVGLCVGTGNFTGAEDRIKVSDAFPGICQYYNVLGPQDYGWPTMQSQIPWHALRWTKWHDDIEQAFGKDMSFMPMECGLTQAVLEGRPDVGWQTYADGVTDESYLATMRWYNEQLCQLPYAQWAFVYIFHGYGDWATFDHINRPQVWWAMKDFDAEGPPPPDDNGGDDMDIKVFDLEYKERDLAYAQSKYGVAFRRAEVQPGQKVYRLAELWEKTGHSSLITQVLNEDGQPVAEVDVAFHWPDAPDLSIPIYTHDWHRNFVHGLTNENGEVGPGMGPGAYHGEGEGGPHAVWVRDPDIPSDICEKLGMLAGTNHDHLDQKFQLMVEGGEPEPPGPGGKVLKFKERVVADHDANMLGIAIPPDYALEQDARGDFRGPGIDEPPIHPVEWEHSDGTRMALIEGCANFNGNEGEAREFTMRARNLKTSGWLTEEQKENFASLETGDALQRVVYVYELGDEPHPPPQPQGDVTALAGALASLARDVAARWALFAAEMDGLAGG